MTTAYWNLAGGSLTQDWSNNGLITANDDWSGVPSIMGYLGDYTTASPTAVDPRTIIAAAPTTVDVIANQANPNTLTSGGVAEFQIANPVVALQGSGTADAPNLVFYLDATGRQNVRVRYLLRDIDGSTDNAVQAVALQYRISATADWTNVPEGYVADATEGGTATKTTEIDVILPADANNAATLEVRVITTNAAQNDEWVGVDDIIVSSEPAGPGVPGTLSIQDTSVREGDSGTADLSFVVNRIGGAAGAVSATYTVTLPGGRDGADINDFDGLTLTGTVSFAAGQTSARITLPVRGDTLPEFDERVLVTLSDPTGGATIDRATATGTILNDDILPLLIGEIQGAAHISPVAGQVVRTAGIVTAVDSNGFYLQDSGDGDVRTSDGIFVFTGTAPDVFVGDGISIQATVTEFRGGTGGLTITQLSSAEITIDSIDNVLPAAVLIGQGGRMPPSQVIDDDRLTSFDPATDGIDFWESLEGMRVTLDAPQVVANTSTTVAGANTFIETDVVVSGGIGATGINARGGITISDGDYNPEKIQLQVDRTIFDGFNPNYTIGDQLTNVTGVVNYAAANFEVLVTEAVSVTRDVTLGREVTELRGDARSLSLATYNMENLDPTDSKFDQLARDVVVNLGRPDVLGVQEIQDANGAASGGTLSGQATADKLIAAIRAAGGGNYAYVEIAPSAPNTTGGEPNGNIRNGFFYNIDRVSYVAGSAELIEGAAYNGTRRPLVAEFDFLPTGERLTAINVHLTSRGGSEPLWGANQPPADAGDAARTNQALGVKNYVAALLQADPTAKVALMGDFNGFAWEEAQTQLTDRARGGMFTDLATLLAPEERYSYMFQGNSQQLDHILVTDSLVQGARYDAVHINSEFAGNRPTDHDPQLTLLRMDAPAAAPAAATTFDHVSMQAFGADQSVAFAMPIGPAHLLTEQVLMIQ